MTTGIHNAKYSLVNRILYQVIGVINLNKIKNWEELKKSSRWVNLNFQSHSNNREAKYFSYNFKTKNAGGRAEFFAESCRR